MAMATVLPLLPLNPVPRSSLRQSSRRSQWSASKYVKFDTPSLYPQFCQFRRWTSRHRIVAVAGPSKEIYRDEGAAQTVVLDCGENVPSYVGPVIGTINGNKPFLGKSIAKLRVWGIVTALSMVIAVRVAAASVVGPSPAEKKRDLVSSPVAASVLVTGGGNGVSADSHDAEHCGESDGDYMDGSLSTEEKGNGRKAWRIEAEGRVAISGVPIAADLGENGEESRREFEEWKAKPYALTVPLNIVGLQGSVPPVWLKDFATSQGKRVKVVAKFKPNLNGIYADLSRAVTKKQLTPQSALAADLVTIGDSWLTKSISGGLLSPIENVEKFSWYQRLGTKWHRYLRRNDRGNVDPNGKVWAVPYRWGTLVIAYNREKLRSHGITPIEDWEDLWKPELYGRIAMVASPREVVGAVLKSLGASYNAQDFETDVPGGRQAVQEKFKALQKQVRLFDSIQYLKTLGAGETWVAVGWSGDVIPFAKRTSNISVIIPRSGTSLWADLWAVPATTPSSKKVGGRIRGPSPLVFQWLDFCLQSARASSFKGDVFIGASPLALAPKFSVQHKSLGTGDDADSNLDLQNGVYHAPDETLSFLEEVEASVPQHVLEKSEFLEPLSQTAADDFKWLLSKRPEESKLGLESLKRSVQNMFGRRARSD